MSTLVKTPGGPVIYAPLSPGDELLPGRGRACWQTDEWGCMECAIATLLQVDRAEIPPRPVGDDETSEELVAAVQKANEDLNAWVRSRGLRMINRNIGPVVWRGWWIGVDKGPFGWSHTVVCRGRRLVFDPALACPVPPGHMVAPVTKLDYAITFEKLETP